MSRRPNRSKIVNEGNELVLQTGLDKKIPESQQGPGDFAKGYS